MLQDEMYPIRCGDLDEMDSQQLTLNQKVSEKRKCNHYIYFINYWEKYNMIILKIQHISKVNLSNNCLSDRVENEKFTAKSMLWYLSVGVFVENILHSSTLCFKIF